MTYTHALERLRRQGAAHADDQAVMAGFCEGTLQLLVGAVSPKLVWEGATKKGLTASELLHLCDDPLAVADLMWI